MKITTEALLTGAEGFGMRTATPAQRAACRIIDGLPLEELRDHPDVAALVGGAEAIERLPSERGVMPTEIIFLASIRSGKTLIAVSALVRMMLTVTVEGLVAGEMPRASMLNRKLKLAASAHRMAVAMVRRSSALRSLLVGEPTTDAFVLRHPSGAAIEGSIVAGAKAGAGLVTDWSAGFVADEAPRMAGAAEAVVNLEHARDAVLGRLLPGAQALYIGSPHAPFGPVYEWVRESWGRPSADRVVLRGTGPMLNPEHWTPERCAELARRNPVAYRTDVLGEFADPESGLLSPAAITASTREEPLELEPEPGKRYVAAVDPSGGGAGANATTLVIVLVEPLDIHRRLERDRSERLQHRYRVALAREWRGTTPGRYWAEIAELCRRYGIAVAHIDGFAAAANKDLARLAGLQLHVRTGSKLDDFLNLQTLLHEGHLELSPEPQLQADLRSIKRRVTQTGEKIDLPIVGGRHADFAPALASGLYAARFGAAPFAFGEARVTSQLGARWHADDRRLLGRRDRLEPVVDQRTGRVTLQRLGRRPDGGF